MPKSVLKRLGVKAGEIHLLRDYEPGDHENGAALKPVGYSLRTDLHGASRVRGTRVTLDTIVTAFHAGAAAEEIAQKFPTVALADVY